MDVLLVNMPFHGFWPSLGLSLLKARLTEENISTKVLYFGLPFAKKIGTTLYSRIANGDPRPMDLLGEWIFTPALYGSASRRYADEILRNRSDIYSEERSMSIPQKFIDEALKVQSFTPEFADDCMQEILRCRPKIVGFGSVFHQQIASLSVAKRIKNQSPETFIVFGGGNCEGVMGAELARQFPFIDAVVSGEGEVALPQIVKRHLLNRTIDDLKGVFCGSNVSTAFQNRQFPSAEKISALDQLPYPDYEDYFEQQKEIHPDLPNQIVFETSRGCWWGEKSHCTFCGISEDAMTYRSKSGERALQELTYLTEKYESKKIHVVDCILDMKYFRDFFPALASRNLDLDLFYEVKANLKKEQVHMLRDAGVKTIQPGIESFSNHILSLMGKGVKVLQNIQLLKWCKEYDIGVSWNILWGFPGEDREDYESMERLIPLLTHLVPPQALGKIRLDRFSPYFERADEYGLTDVRAHPAYHFIYNMEQGAVQNLAYFFLYEYATKISPWDYTKNLWHEVKKWWDADFSNDLFFLIKDDRLIFCDLRSAAKEPLKVLTGLQKNLYLFCDRYRSLAELQQIHPDAESLVDPLVQGGIMIQENHLYLSLAIPIGEYALKGAALAKFCCLLSDLGTITAKDEFTIPLP